MQVKKIISYITKPRHLTVMLVPSYNAKIRRVNIPYWAAGLIVLPFLCFIVILAVFQSRTIALERNSGKLSEQYENEARISSYKINALIEENSILKETLNTTQGEFEQIKSEADLFRSSLNDFEGMIAQILEKVDEISGLERGILDIFEQIGELNIPFTFDADSLTGSSNRVSGINTDDAGAVLAIISSALTDNLDDMRKLHEFTQELSSYFKARPIGSPAPGAVISSGFGRRDNPLNPGVRSSHTGLDIAADMRTQIYATADGVVTFSGWSASGSGNLIIIEHGYGFTTSYAHNYRNLVTEGETVERGQLIALMGSTGTSTGPHVHYEVLVEGVAQNPRLYIHD